MDSIKRMEIKIYFKNLLEEKLSYMRTLSVMDKEITLDGKLKPCLSSRFPGSAKTIKIVNSMMIGEYRNMDWQGRNQRTDDDTCKLCGLEREDVVHTLTRCEKLNTQPSVIEKRRRLNLTWTENNVTTANHAAEAKLILDPQSVIGCKNQKVVTKFVSQSRELVQELAFSREQLIYIEDEQAGGDTSGDSEGNDAGESGQCPPSQSGPGEERDGGETKGKSSDKSFQIEKFVNFFKPRQAKARVRSNDPNENIGDQLLGSIIAPGASLVIGCLATEHGRIVVWTHFLDKADGRCQAS